MMRFLTRFFIPFCLLLLGVKLHGARGGVSDPHPRASIGKDAQSRRSADRIKAIEIEEEDESDHSRREKPDDSPMSLFYENSLPCSFHTTDSLPCCEHISWLSSFKFIMHRAIRI